MKREPNAQTDLRDFLEREVYPALWNRLDAAFPEFGFQNKGRYWQATDETTTRGLPGAPRPDRVNAYENTPFGFVIHGGDFVPWVAYVAGGIPPQGRDFVEAVRKLADLAGVSFPETRGNAGGSCQVREVGTPGEPVGVLPGIHPRLPD